MQELKKQIAARNSQIEEAKEQWTTLYAAYYQERPVKECTFTEEELDAEFASAKIIVEQGLGSVFG